MNFNPMLAILGKKNFQMEVASTVHCINWCQVMAKAACRRNVMQLLIKFYTKTVLASNALTAPLPPKITKLVKTTKALS